MFFDRVSSFHSIDSHLFIYKDVNIHTKINDALTHPYPLPTYRRNKEQCISLDGVLAQCCANNLINNHPILANHIPLAPSSMPPTRPAQPQPAPKHRATQDTNSNARKNDKADHSKTVQPLIEPAHESVK